MATTISVGARCDVNGETGTVRFVGETRFAPGKWVGVELDSAAGKNDGEVQGERYFECPSQRGVFVRPVKVQVLASLSGTPANVAVTGARELSEPGPAKSPPSTMRRVASNADTSGTPSARVSRSSTPLMSDNRSTSTLAAAPPSRHTLNTLVARIKSLEAQRVADAEKLANVRELESKSELEAVIKAKLMQRMQAQQTELRNLRSRVDKLTTELAEAQAAKNDVRQDEELLKLNELLEMTTLEKETAETERDELQDELKALRDRVEELQLELEILRDASPIIEGDVDGKSILNLQAQNGRLREALIRLDDLSKEQAATMARDSAAVQEKEAELAKVRAGLSNTTADIARLEAIVADLREQIDLTVGSEDMLELLAERNLALSEKLAVCQQEVADLEVLKEVSDELEATQQREYLEVSRQLASKEAALSTLELQARDDEAQQERYLETIERMRDVIAELQDRLVNADSVQANAVADAETITRQVQSLQGERLSTAEQLRKVAVAQWELRVAGAQHVSTAVQLRVLSGSRGNQVQHPSMQAYAALLGLSDLLGAVIRELELNQSIRSQLLDLTREVLILACHVQTSEVEDEILKHLAGWAGTALRDVIAQTRQHVLGTTTAEQLKMLLDDIGRKVPLPTSSLVRSGVRPEIKLRLLELQQLKETPATTVLHKLRKQWRDKTAPDCQEARDFEASATALADTNVDDVDSSAFTAVKTTSTRLLEKAQPVTELFVHHTDLGNTTAADRSVRAGELAVLQEKLASVEEDLRSKTAALAEERLRGELLQSRVKEETKLSARIKTLEKELVERAKDGPHKVKPTDDDGSGLRSAGTTDKVDKGHLHTLQANDDLQALVRMYQAENLRLRRGKPKIATPLSWRHRVNRTRQRTADRRQLARDMRTYLAGTALIELDMSVGAHPTRLQHVDLYYRQIEMQHHLEASLDLLLTQG